jgi:hypothetical protein
MTARAASKSLVPGLVGLFTGLLLVESWQELPPDRQSLGAFTAVAAIVLGAVSSAVAFHLERRGKVKVAALSIGGMLVVVAVIRSTVHGLSDVGLVALWAALTGAMLSAVVMTVREALRERAGASSSLPMPPPPQPKA